VGVELERYGKKFGRYQGAAADADLAGSAAWFTPIGQVPLLTSGSGRPGAATSTRCTSCPRR
jgi:hypothetical protein